ncbi:MAG TPA: endonuclease/exonuclease/phosphatase family protein [Candidatus Binatia bacterium]|nr:endonuclease/exonuclease/phosphatase family protein [Candidatus Binatia bacterium]
MTIRIATLNCWNVSEPFAARMALVRAELERLAPDVVGLQEIVVRARDRFDQAALILDGLGWERVFAPAYRWNDAGLAPLDDPTGHAFGNVVASRWPIRGSATRTLPGAEAGERRGIVGALIESPAGPLPVCTTHLAWRPADGALRERQVVAVADFVRGFAGAATLAPIVVGDFNAEPDTAEMRCLREQAGFTDAWQAADAGPGYTWDNRNPFAAPSGDADRRIDYVLVGGAARVVAARLAFAVPADGVFPSDHFGVVVDLAL